MQSIQVECVRNAQRLATCEDDFSRLSKGATMQRLSWLMPWWHAYQANHRLHVLMAFDQNRIVGIFPLVEKTNPLTGRSLVMMGSGKACSDNVGILSEDSYEESVAAAFANWLVRSPDCCRWDHLDLDGIRENNRTMQHFEKALQALTGCQVERKSSPNCWSVCLAGGIDNYRGRLTKRARRIVREAESGIDSGRGEFELASTQAEAREFLGEIERMHQARWHERGIDGCFSNQEFGRFLHGAIESMWEDPWVDSLGGSNESDAPHQRVILGRLRINGIVAAGSICFRDRDAIAMYLAGMNPDISQSRPGWMLNMCFIRHACALGCNRFDFMRGDEEYKERLGGEPSVQHRWLIPSHRLTSQIRNAAYRTAVTVKGWWNHGAIGLPTS